MDFKCHLPHLAKQHANWRLFFFIFRHTHLGQRIHLLETDFLGGKPYFPHIINVKTYVYLVGHKTNMTIRM